MSADSVWLAAHYHFPATYSCRTPLSSKSSTLASPGPGPATVRLACIRASCEVWGSHVTREEVFPIICAAQMRVRPPEQVAISQQVLQGYKARSGQAHATPSLIASLQYREVAHAQGALSIYIQIPKSSTQHFQELLMAIGYWGQTDSLTMCLAVEEAAPNQSECLLPLRLFQGSGPLGAFLPCVLADFRQPGLTWEEVVPTAGERGGEELPLAVEVYIWPMQIVKRSSGNTLLVRHPFLTTTTS